MAERTKGTAMRTKTKERNSDRTVFAYAPRPREMRSSSAPPTIVPRKPQTTVVAPTAAAAKRRDSRKRDNVLRGVEWVWERGTWWLVDEWKKKVDGKRDPK
jgi:hypothetical protein